MLDAFASVGAQQFDLTLTDAAGHKWAIHVSGGLTSAGLILSQLLTVELVV